MRFAPDGVHREPAGDQRPAQWYVIWLGKPHADGSIVLGRAKRLRRHLHYRVFPEDGSACREIKGFTMAQEWLLDLHRRQPPLGAPD